ncbi:MAG TPA: hypothetical protein VLT33_36090 [Labilithrix sp.]|nr:hypothetical protein [Labilithrix sp.]
MATAGLLAACAVEEGGGDEASDEAEIRRKPNQVQMNDVSVLFPLAKTQAEMAGHLAAAAAGNGGPLLPAKLYTDATGQPKSRTGPGNVGSDVGLAYDDLKVVAFRVDPCFANIGPVVDASSRKNQLRIIFQAVSFADRSASTVDGAVHAFYSLTREELVGVVGEIVALRKQESGSKSLGALAVHPTLAAQGLLGSESKGLARILLAHAGPKNLTRFTIFTPGNLATRWDFAGFDVSQGKTKPMVIPTLPGKATNVSFFAGFGSDLAGGFTPPTTAKDDMQLLGNLATARAATKANQQAAFDAALRIENPEKHSPDTIDCASCHVAGPARVLTGTKLSLSATGNANAFKRDAKFVTAAEMKQTTAIDGDTSRNFHVFSYRDAHPMIAMRVINETASVVAYLNGNVLDK